MAKEVSPDLIFLNSDYHDLIGLIYDAISSRDGFLPFLKRFVEVFGGHSGSFAIYDTKNSCPLGYWLVNIPEHALAFYTEHIAHQDALVDAALKARQNKGLRFVASNLDIDNVEEIARRTRISEWMASFGAQIAAGAIVFHNDNYLNFFGMQRSAEQPGFSRDELAIFDLFLPHINRAVELYTNIGAMNRESSPERTALDSVQQGILIFDATFRVVFKNRTANEIIAANKGLTLDDDGLLSFREKEFSREFVTSLSLAVRSSLESSNESDVVLCYRHGARNLTMIVSPLATSSPNSEKGDSRGGAMISLYDWTSRPSISPEVLQNFFGLSRAESRVSAFLLAGYSLADIAGQLNRSRETVKSHLQSIYRKTNTSRQGELVALLAASGSAG